MNSNATPVLCFTRDSNLASRCRALTEPAMRVHIASNRVALVQTLRQTGPAVAIIDTSSTGNDIDMAELASELSGHLLIVLGAPRSDPLRHAETLRPYVLDTLPISDQTLRNHLRQACQHLELLEENRLLRRPPAHSGDETSGDGHAIRHHGGDTTLSFREVFRILRCLDDLDKMLDRLVEEVAGSLGFARAGIVLRENAGDDYVLRAGWLLLPDCRRLRFDAHDPFVCWLERHAHLVNHRGLDNIQSPSERIMVRRMLDGLGAEWIVPLRARDALLGWLFVGHHITGQPLNRQRMDELATVGDVITASLESALLYHEVSVQQKLAEHLLESIPSGILFVSPDGTLRWFSSAAATILERDHHALIHQPIENLGPRFADLAYRSLREEADEQPVEWTDPSTGRQLQASAHRLSKTDEDGLGVLLIVTDISARKAFEAQQDRLERTVFWNDLAAGMSHEIRNPLVSIKTFAQLLPERYTDPEFRNEFSRMVNVEVDRLNGIIDQINQFARRPELHLSALDICRPLREALKKTVDPHVGNNTIRVFQTIPKELPRIVADETALEDCFERLFVNAVEALSGRADATIRILVETVRTGSADATLMLRIADNGPGMPPEIREKVFSPFCTTKARGMGLGLSIAQRTIADHHGRLLIESSEYGTHVTLILPVATEKEDDA